MIRFSEIDFEDEMYCIPGRVDEFALEACEPLKDRLMLSDNTEILTVFYTVYLLNDGDTQTVRDAYESEIAALEDNFADFLANSSLSVQEEGKFKLYGLLTMPYEDFYKLWGTERRDYLESKAAAKAEVDSITAQLKAQGCSDDDIDDWFRFNYWGKS